MIHELIHFTRSPKHSKKFWKKVALWYDPRGTHMARALKDRALAHTLEELSLNMRPMPSVVKEVITE